MTAGAVINCEPGFETTLLSASSASPRRTLICFWLQTRSGVAIATCSGLLYFRPAGRGFFVGPAAIFLHPVLLTLRLLWGRGASCRTQSPAPRLRVSLSLTCYAEASVCCAGYGSR